MRMSAYRPRIFANLCVFHRRSVYMPAYSCVFVRTCSRTSAYLPRMWRVTQPRISANLRELCVFAYSPYIRVYPRISAVYPPYIHVYWSAYRPRICRIFAANLCEIYAYSRMELVTAAIDTHHIPLRGLPTPQRWVTGHSHSLCDPHGPRVSCVQVLPPDTPRRSGPTWPGMPGAGPALPKNPIPIGHRARATGRSAQGQEAGGRLTIVVRRLKTRDTSTLLTRGVW